MKIIMLSGLPKTGKTTTFHDLYDLLTKGMYPKPEQIPIEGAGNDFECAFQYDGKEVALYSMGDVLHLIYDTIIKYSYVDVLIMAHSIRGKEMNLPAEQVKECSHHCLVKKTKNNDKDCQTIISKI